MSQLIRSASSLLEYAIETYPPQLNASTPSDPVTATLMVTVRRKAPSEKVRCGKLSLWLRTGEGGSAWTDNPSVMTGGIEGGDGPGQGDGWGWSARDDGEWRIFDFEPTTDAEFEGWQLTLKVFEIEINNAPGWADVKIDEMTSTSGSTTPKTTSHRVQKAPKEFVFHSFSPQDLMVENGQTVTLGWQGTQTAAYSMFWDQGEERNLQFDEDRPFGTWVSRPLHAPTGFMLQALFEQDGQRYGRTLTTTVSVIKPDLEVGNLTIHGTVTANETVHINKELHVDQIHSNSDTPITLKSPARMEDDTTLAGGIIVQGRGITVDGPVTITGPLTEIAHFGSGWSRLAFTAKTAGVVYGRKTGPLPKSQYWGSNGSGTGYMTYTYTPAKTGEMSVQTDLATVTEKGEGTFIVPVAKDQKFTIGFDAPYLDEAACRFYWLPFGNVADSIAPSPLDAKEQESESCEQGPAR